MKTFKKYIEEIKLGARSSPNTDNFMDDYHNSTSEHPSDPRSRVHGDSATSELSPVFGKIHMSDIRALKPGGGHAALEKIKSLADKHGVAISGHAKAYHPSDKYPMKSKQLASYYKKRGFEVGKGSESEGYPISYKPKNK